MEHIFRIFDFNFYNSKEDNKEELSSSDSEAGKQIFQDKKQMK